MRAPEPETIIPDDGTPRDIAAAERTSTRLKEDLATHGLHFGDPVFLRVFKEERQLEIWLRERETKTYRHFRTYPIAAMSGVLGPKLIEGDKQAPEGFYYFSPASMNPRSTFHLSFNIGYPNEYDRAHDRTGTYLMVHGSDVSIGCFAMTDPKIEEIYTLCGAAFENGQRIIRIHCFPFRMTDERMALAKESPWFPFWENLREGYQWFETRKTPPETKVENKRYVFQED